MKINALKVNQWQQSWDEVRYDPKSQQSEPPKYFYLCSIKAGHLKALTGVYQRSVKGGKPRAMEQRYC